MESKRKFRLGQVVSDKMDKTVVVAVETPKRHRLYKKTMKRVVRYKAHDEKNKCRTGDKVMIVETRPLSREKRWRVAEILAKAEVVEISPEEITREDLAKVLPEKKPKEKEVPEVKAEEEIKEEEEEKAEAAETKPAKKAKEKVTEAKAEAKTEEEKKAAEEEPEKKPKEERKTAEAKAEETKEVAEDKTTQAEPEAKAKEEDQAT
jgi:small subunit ribosomal protein S17